MRPTDADPARSPTHAAELESDHGTTSLRSHITSPPGKRAHSLGLLLSTSALPAGFFFMCQYRVFAL